MKLFIISIGILAFSLGDNASLKHNGTPIDILKGKTGSQWSSKAGLKTYPYLVTIENERQHICAGTIISEDYVLTSAHCIILRHIDEITIQAGTTEYGLYGSSHGIIGRKVHPEYQGPDSFDNNIAILKVYPPFVFGENIKKINLVENGYVPEVGVKGFGIRWGEICSSCGNIPEVDKVDLYIYSNDECSRFYETSGAPTDKMVCSGKRPFQEGVCLNDAGGPLILENIQIGISSHNRMPCGSLPEVFTQVAPYREWIMAVTGI